MLIDLHCDTISVLLNKDKTESLKRNHLCVDIEKLKQSGSLAQFFALYIDKNAVVNPFETAMRMLDKFYSELDLNSADIAVAKNYNEMMTNKANGKISAFLTIEEGGVIKGELANLRNFYRLGVRLMTLTWNYPNEIGYPNFEWQYQKQGLTEFGKCVVAEMNRLGMLIDVSHLSDQGFYDVAILSKAPFIASHSNSRAITNHPRNLTDDMIRKIAEHGGVIGLNFAAAFLGESPTSRIEDMIRHVKQIYKVGGIDVLAIGTDFDGTAPNFDIVHIGHMDKLRDALQENGFTAAELDKIWHKNSERVIREVC
ncbi:dipeptidase [Anaerosinus massiliensis]|uniref:dipeptidase n=1 Tax=Massilibacillus massiliensis TaxID=1806837 RepID=UPI000AA9B446|nr:dipeptidase [Massilibacillus massiliensis]